MNEYEKMGLHAFCQGFRLFSDTALNCKTASGSFLFLFLMVEKLWILSGPHCIISAHTQDYEIQHIN